MLQGHPRPWPFAKLRTLWVPAHKVQGTKTDSAVLAFYLAFSLGGARASCHLRHSVPDKEAVHVRVAPVGGFLVLHSRAGSARRQRPGSRQSRQPRLRRRSSKVSRHGVSACLSTDAIPPASASCRRGRHLQKLPGIRGAGRSGPGLGGRLQTASKAIPSAALRGLVGLETLALGPAARSSTVSTTSPAPVTRPRDSKPTRSTRNPRSGGSAYGSGVPRSGTVTDIYIWLTGKNPCLTIAFLSAAPVTRHKNGLWHGRSLRKTICLDLGSNYMGWT